MTRTKTPKKKKITWEHLTHNSILRGRGFYISYNAGMEDNPTAKMFTHIGNMFGGNLKDGEETALCDQTKEIWYILEGDFRKEYEVAFPKGKKACLAVYNKHKKNHRSNWSTD